jgi:HAD superfamily hydrolase (TIGR01549 family)
VSDRRLDAVFLDLDATLLDESYVVVASVATCRVIAGEHPQLDAAALAQANYEVWTEYWPEVELGWVLGTVSTDELRHETWHRTLDRFGASSEEIIARASALHHEFELAEYLPFDDVMPLINELRGRGVKVVVITNGASDVQREKLDVLGLTDLVDGVIVSGEFGIEKPDPRIFAAALAVAGVTADRAAHVGDSLRADVGGALASGITAIWLNRADAALGPNDPSPDLEVASLAEVALLLDQRG